MLSFYWDHWELLFKSVNYYYYFEQPLKTYLYSTKILRVDFLEDT